MAEKSYYETLKAGLEDTVAFIHEDVSRGRIVEVEKIDVYGGIMEGLKEALAYKQGDHSVGKVSIRKIPSPAVPMEDAEDKAEKD